MDKIPDMRSLTADDKRWECEEEGCEKRPSKGEPIYRTSPKGEPFRGRCAAHMRTKLIHDG